MSSVNSFRPDYDSLVENKNDTDEKSQDADFEEIKRRFAKIVLSELNKANEILENR